MALNMRSNFLGGSLKSANAETKAPAGRLQVQAIFGLGKKKPQQQAKKTAKSGTQKFGGALKQAQKAVQQVIFENSILTQESPTI